MSNIPTSGIEALIKEYNIPQDDIIVLQNINQNVLEIMTNKSIEAYVGSAENAEKAKNYADNASTYADNASKSAGEALASKNAAKTSEDNARNSALQAEQYKNQAFNTTPSGYENLLQKVVWFDDNGILNIGGLA